MAKQICLTYCEYGSFCKIMMKSQDPSDFLQETNLLTEDGSRCIVKLN